MIKKYLALALTTILCTCGTLNPVAAKGFSTSYGSSRSYSAPSRSYSAPRPTITRNVTVNRTTIVHQNTGGGGSGNGLLTGLVVGSMLSQPRQVAPAPVIIEQAAPAPQVIEQPVVQAAPQLVQAPQPEDSSHWFLWTLVFLLIGTGIYYALHANTKPKN